MGEAAGKNLLPEFPGHEVDEEWGHKKRMAFYHENQPAVGSPQSVGKSEITPSVGWRLTTDSCGPPLGLTLFQPPLKLITLAYSYPHCEGGYE